MFTRFVWTRDELDLDNPIKRYPEKECHKALLGLCMTERLLAVEKSRKLMVTWTMALYLGWVCMFKPARHVVFQSQTVEKAADTVARVEFSFSRLPSWLRPDMEIERVEGGVGKLRFPRTGSVIRAIAHGGDTMRHWGLSAALIDEGAFQSELESSIGAVLPALGGKGQLLIPSTANGKNYFWKLTQDKLQE